MMVSIGPVDIGFITCHDGTRNGFAVVWGECTCPPRGES